MNKHNLRTSIAAALGLLVLIFDGKTAISGAIEGVNLCLNTLIPSLSLSSSCRSCLQEHYQDRLCLFFALSPVFAKSQKALKHSSQLGYWADIRLERRM
jgi:hypothetical protein